MAVIEALTIPVHHDAALGYISPTTANPLKHDEALFLVLFSSPIVQVPVSVEQVRAS